MAKAGGKDSKNPKPAPELQVAIYNWIEATSDFEEWRHRLSKVITASATTYAGDRQVLVNLHTVYEDLIDAMTTLANDVNKKDQRGELSLEQLVEHTNTIRQWSEKIQHLLSVETKGLA